MNDIETGALSTVDQIHDRFADMHAHYYTYEWTWAYEKMLKFYQLDAERITASDICTIVRQWQDSVVGLDRLVYEDAKKEFSLTSMTGFGADGSKAEQKLDVDLDDRFRCRWKQSGAKTRFRASARCIRKQSVRYGGIGTYQGKDGIGK